MKYRFYEKGGMEMVEIETPDGNKVNLKATDQHRAEAKALEPPEVELKTTGIVPDDPRPSRQPPPKKR